MLSCFFLYSLPFYYSLSNIMSQTTIVFQCQPWGREGLLYDYVECSSAWGVRHALLDVSAPTLIR